MTLPYGSSAYGRRQQIQEYVFERGTEADQDFKRIVYLASATDEALKEALPGAMTLMDYLKGLAIAAKHRPIEWIAPSGFHIVQAPFRPATKEVDTYIAGRIRWRFTVHKDTDEIDADAQINEIVPNVIHSLDAAHMAFVLAGSSRAVSSFMMIHDSFGTHAADAPFLGVMVRTYFALIHQVDYSPYRGIDNRGHRFFSYRPWDHPYSPMLFMSDEEDGGTLLGHISRCIKTCPDERTPLDLRSMFPDMYNDEDDLPAGVWTVPYQPETPLKDASDETILRRSATDGMELNCGTALLPERQRVYLHTAGMVKAGRLLVSKSR
jgi:DNA-dependent RNA polymerase